MVIIWLCNWISHIHVSPYLDELILWLVIHHDIIISVSVLHENLKQSGLTWKVVHNLPCSEMKSCEHSGGQQDPCLSGDGLEFICLDKTSKNEHSCSC
jgi:hypothetical protein